MEGLVSLLIPCYNGERFLERCFNTILNQTYNLVEIIFVNDGSTDKTENIVKKYEVLIKNKGYRFKYIYQKNQGAAAAINTSLKYVEGEYIMLLDVDDILYTTAIEDKAQFLKDNLDYVMVRNNGYYVNNDNLERNIELFINTDYEKNNEYIFEDLILGKTNNWPSSFMVRTNILFSNIKNKSIYISQYGQNLQIMLPVALNGKSGFIDKPLMKYVKHPESHSYSADFNKKIDLLNGYEKNRIEILKTLDKLSEKQKSKYINMIRCVYFRLRMDIYYQYNEKKFLMNEYKNFKNHSQITIKDKFKYYIRISGIGKLYKYHKLIIRKITY